MSQRGQRVLLLLGSGLFALVLAEACLWALDIPKNISSFRFLGNVFDEPDVFEEDPDLFWRLRPDTDRYRVNDLGLRGPEIVVRKDPRDLRIACFGDSCTFGSQVRLEDTYGWLLQQSLQQRLPNRRVQAILAALPGYSSYQSLALFRKHIAARRPDITVLYIGGYNDYVPAMGESDGQRAARLATQRNSLWRRWRLVRLGAQILAPKPKLTRAEYVAAFKRGEAPDGRRVPLAEFRANLEAMIQEARAVGSKVLLLVPPLPSSTFDQHPVARDYRGAVVFVAKAAAAQLVDATAAFASYPVPDGADLPTHQRGYWPCFVDWVHPSVLGHRLLADALRDALKNHQFVDPGSLAEIKLQLSTQQVTAGRNEGVFARCETGHVWDGSSRAMVGNWWVQHQYWKAVRRLGFRLPEAVAPGSYPVRVVTNLGMLTCPEPLVVKPPPLAVDISRQGNTLTLRLQITGPKDWPVGVWISVGKRKAPAPTRFGPFHLVADPDGRPPGSGDDTPFMFLRLQLPQAAGTIPADGTWRHETKIDLTKLGKIPTQIHAQGLMHRGAAHGILTEVVTRAVPQ